MNDFYTENMSDIMQCTRERDLMFQILHAWENVGLPDDFCDVGVKFAFNRNSGNVFLVNADGQFAMMNGDALESYYSTPHDGCEGFWPELVEKYRDMHPTDQEYMRDIANGRELPELKGATS